MSIFRKLVLVFTLVPLVEFIILWQLSTLISFPVTIGIIIITGFLGAYLTKSQGLRTLANYQKNLSQGKLPHRDVIEGIMILVAGAVLLTPGFLTDLLGFSLLIPQVREQGTALITQRLKGKVGGGGKRGTPMSQPRSASHRGDDDNVIEIETEEIPD